MALGCLAWFVQGIMPARGWIQEGGYEGAPTSHPSTQTQDFPMGVEPMPGAPSPLDFVAREASNRANTGHL